MSNAKNLDESEVQKYKSLNSLFDDYVLGKIDGFPVPGSDSDFEEEENIFKKTFSLLKAVDNNSARSLRKFENGKFSGKVTIANFSVLAAGLGRYLTNPSQSTEITLQDLESKIQAYWTDPIKSKAMSSYELANQAIKAGKTIFGVS